ncbi:MAG: substrate-binding domain-containing protein [Candidatus Devosia euplotis]|nr:substrate-binding domain-containing protein [Candidatus Devosia euplotis]
MPQGRPTAIVFANDDTAIGFIKTVADNGLSVLGDVSIVGFDGASVGAFMTPSLSTVQQSTAEMGLRAVELVTEMALGELSTPPLGVEIPCSSCCGRACALLLIFRETRRRDDAIGNPRYRP